ncbi:hypothetical protein [Shinella sp.]|uniref:hypothetical protein n=1 Tax=Shinella sp. TaxID=1870904 RepID=UPI0040367201
MTDPLSKLPLFATDHEIAIAVVGKERASMYMKAVIPVLERQGFPKMDRCTTAGRSRPSGGHQRGWSAPDALWRSMVRMIAVAMATRSLSPSQTI